MNTLRERELRQEREGAHAEGDRPARRGGHRRQGLRQASGAPAAATPAASPGQDLRVDDAGAGVERDDAGVIATSRARGRMEHSESGMIRQVAGAAERSPNGTARTWRQHNQRVTQVGNALPQPLVVAGIRIGGRLELIDVRGQALEGFIRQRAWTRVDPGGQDVMGAEFAALASSPAPH